MRKKLIPERREWGCDICKKDVPTELFLGYNRNVLWICGDCYKNIIKHNLKNIKKHSQDIWGYKPT